MLFFGGSDCFLCFDVFDGVDHAVGERLLDVLFLQVDLGAGVVGVQLGLLLTGLELELSDFVSVSFESIIFTNYLFV